MTIEVSDRPCPECGEDSATTESSRDEGSAERSSADHSSGQSPREDGETAEEGGELAIKTLQSGSRLVGCTRYPDCEYSLPLPRRGDIEVTDGYCDDHDLPELVVHSGDDPWELGCPICNYREFQARESESGSDLESLEGIGAKTVEKLADAGIEDLADLTEADPDAVAEDVDGVSADRVRNWQAKA